MSELEELRAKVARYELTDKDRKDPNVLLLEGRIDSYGSGEYSAWSIDTGAGEVYLCQVLEDLMDWKNILTLQWHMSTKPMGFYELEENLVKTAMGVVRIDFYHSYSDLTGYLWTNEKIEIAGHDVLGEIANTYHELAQHGSVYIALRAEKEKK